MKNIVDEMLQSRKYRSLDLPACTVSDLLQRELDQLSPKEALKAVKRKLHNIVAPYLGDPDYINAAAMLERAFSSTDAEQVRRACIEILSQHASTRERLSIVEDFYREIFRLTGAPQTLLDVACGLNPLAFPWMGLPLHTRYYAYDIHTPRIALINHYFRLLGMPGLAEVRDVLVQPPEVEADAVFLFKEAHRFEQRRRGCNLPLWQKLKTRWLLVSLPTHSLNGRNDLTEKHRRLVYGILEQQDWQVQELLFENEMVFCIDKKT